MGKKFAMMMLIFLVIFCYIGPIKGGQGSIEIQKKVKPHIPSECHIQYMDEPKVITGKASWYGPGFHGRITANGEIFDENALTAAHKELPFGTKVFVTNLNNNRSTLVTINDRGPYIKGRHIDLSRAAAKKVGMIDAGVVDVEMKIINVNNKN